MFSAQSQVNNSVTLQSWDSLLKLPIKRLYELFPIVKTKSHETKSRILVKILQLILVQLADKMNFATAMEALNLSRIKTIAQQKHMEVWR